MLGVNIFKPRLVLVICLCLNFFGLLGQSTIVRELGREYPELSQVIYQVRSDKNGVIWIGGMNGLYSFNGSQLKNYVSEDLQKSGVSNIKFDSSDNVFARNFDGQLFKVSGGKVKVLHEFSNISDVIISFEIDQKNRVCLYYEEEFQFYDIEGELLFKHHVNFKEKPLNESSYVRSVKVDSKGNYYLVHNNEICVLEVKNDEVIETKRIVLSKTNPTFNKQDNIFMKNDTLYFIGRFSDSMTSAAGFTKFFKIVNGEVIDSFRRNDLGNARITDVQLVNREVLISTLNGALRMEGFLQKSKVKKFLEKQSITSINKDFQNNLWVSSFKGLKRISNVAYHMTNNKLIDNATSLMGMHNSNSVVITVDNIGNFYVYNKKSMTLDPLADNSLSFGGLMYFENKLLPGNVVFLNGRFYSGSQFIKSGIYKIYCREYAKAHNGVYGSKAKGLFFFGNDGEKRMIEPFRTNGLHYSFKDSALLFQGTTGVFYIKDGNRKELLPLEKSKWLVSLFSSGDTAILCDSKFGLRLYAYGDKLLEIPKSIYENYKVQDVKIYGDLCFILCSSKLVIYSLRSKLWVIQDNEMLGIENMNSIVVSDDQVYISTFGGIFHAPISELKENLSKVKLILKEVFVNNESKGLKERLQLTHEENNLVFKFQGINFFSSKPPLLAYTLRTSSASYQGISNDEQLVFTALSPGEYDLTVYSKYHGIMDSEVISQTFTIFPPFWKTKAFIILLILAIGCIAYLLNRVSMKQIKEKAELQNQLTQSQLTSIKSQMNPHFIFNALNSIQSLVMSGGKKESSLYLKRFSTVIRSTLDFSQEGEISLIEEIELLKSYLDLEKLRFMTDFTYKLKINIDEDDLDEVCLPPMLIQPLVENSIKHGLFHKAGHKELLLDFYIKDNILEIQVVDNGIGRIKSAEINKKRNFSFSTKANLKRIDLLNSNQENKIKMKIVDLYNDNVPSGTRVTVLIPQSGFCSGK